MIELTEVCRFKMKPCKTCGKPKSNKIHREKDGSCKFKRQLGCAECGKAKAHLDHMGAPPSFNVLGWGSKRQYLGLKKQWEDAFVELLKESGLPYGLKHVMVEGEVSYGLNRDRDEDNAIALVRKFFGDALQHGGWLDRDSWGRIDFTKLERQEEPGISRLRLVLFPSY
jgi:hypothetical protein